MWAELAWEKGYPVDPDSLLVLYPHFIFSNTCMSASTSSGSIIKPG